MATRSDLVKIILEKFSTLLKHRSKLEYGLVSLLTAGGESIFSTAIFQCPCNTTWNLPFGLIFLLMPALALFLLGFVLNTRTWRLVTGCWCCCCCCKGRGNQSFTCGYQCFVEIRSICISALVAPLTWVAVGLLWGTFYECFASGSSFIVGIMCVGRKDNCATLMPKLPCLQDREPDLQDLLRELRSQSQVAGWILIAVVILILMIVKCFTYCLSPVSFMQLEFKKIYEKQEQKILTKESRDNATELANKNVKCFFEGSCPDHNSPSAEDWQQISSLYTFNSEEPYYSTLHKHVNIREKGDSFSEGNAEVSTFNIVEVQQCMTLRQQCINL
ncbi:calcium homeostasis modulator protein 6-like [Talpa occidentalis]|uniref:calcium homeostasis modulator protein 6-like n=1 Tax=Talpa occidentalis TaxID=50954 RepID=UPI00188E9FF7|nr:calcium homeostasis modulator protein 6-like [Talpa occidentalis]